MTTSEQFAKDFTDWCQERNITGDAAYSAAMGGLRSGGFTWEKVRRAVMRKHQKGEELAHLRFHARKMQEQIEKRRQHTKPKNDNSQRKKRRCLGSDCGKMFMSWGPGNRLCGECSAQSKLTVQFEGV